MLKLIFQPIYNFSLVLPVGMSHEGSFGDFNKDFGRIVDLEALSRDGDWLKTQGSDKESIIAYDLANFLLESHTTSWGAV